MTTVEPLAIVGMAARWPGADDIGDLCGSDVVGTPSRRVPPSRWAEELLKVGECDRGHFLPDIFSFDHALFSLSAQQAKQLDPQQRVMMELGRQALDESGLLAGAHRRDVGVFVGGRMNSYGYDAPEGRSFPRREMAAAALWGRSQNFLAAWLSDRFDLSGPAVVIDSACSSSLSALWVAAMALRAEECTSALVAGVDLLIDPLTFSLLSQAQVLSPDGESKAFDAAANGYGPGEGAGAIVLRPLGAALRAGDMIHGLLLDVATNNDGRTMGVTTPNPVAQRELLRQIYSKVDPRRLGYVETHGTGTLIGDPIEVQALAAVLTEAGMPPRTVALHSLKRSIGHLHSAAGIASVIHAILRVQEHRIPVTGGLTVNPRLELEGSPLYLRSPEEPEPDRPWDAVGVSAFGFGGTNAHAVVSAPVASNRRDARPEGVEGLHLSAPTPHQLRELAAQWRDALRSTSVEEQLWMLDRQRDRRQHFAYRFSLVAPLAELESQLERMLLADQIPSDKSAAASLPLGNRSERADRWVAALRGTIPRLEKDIASVERVAQAPLESFPVSLRSAVAQLAAAAALSWAGIPPEAVDLGVQDDAVRAYGWGGLTIEEALPRVLQTRTKECQGESALSRLDTSDDPVSEITRIAALAFESGWDVCRRDRVPRGRPTSVPVLQLSGPELNLRETRRSAQLGTPVEVHQTSVEGGWSFTQLVSPADGPVALHEVHGVSMLPGVAWFTFIAEGARAKGIHLRGIADLVFDKPLMPEGPTLVEGRVSREQLLEISVGGDKLARGRLIVDPLPSATVNLSEALASANYLTSGSTTYRWLRRIGYFHGRYYRNLSWIASTPDGTVARIEGQRQAEINGEQAALAPGLLDSITIAAIDPASESFGRDDAEVVIPISVGEAHFHGSLVQAAFVVTITKHRSREAHRFDQHVVDVYGNVLLSLMDISSKRVPDGAFAKRTVEPSRDEGRRHDEYGEDLDADGQGEPVGPLTTAQMDSARPIAGSWAAWLGHELNIDEDDFDTEFLELGLSSSDLVEASDRIGKGAGVELYPTIMFEHPTVSLFANFLLEEGATPTGLIEQPSACSGEGTETSKLGVLPEMGTEEKTADPTIGIANAGPTEMRLVRQTDEGCGYVQATQHRADESVVAVTGIAVRVPGADSYGRFWELVRQGGSSIGRPPSGVGRRSGLGIGSYLETLDQFDPEPFRFSRREAPFIDPQARIIYEVILHALEDAGGTRTRSVGVWIGYSHDHYYEERVRVHSAQGRGLGLEAMVANRLSYVMDWSGPSSVVNTLCSSGLVALHQAKRSLAAGECDMAVVAGVQAGFSPHYFASMRELGALSPDGTSRPFDAAASGFVPGEGAVAIVLQLEGSAHKERRRVRARVLGSAVNHNGRTSRYSAPSAHGQQEVIREALKDAGINPSTIGLVEAHGTGTALGDPIEVDGLTQAWRAFTEGTTQFCALGSVKSALGHLEPASGLVGLAKVIAALENRTIPPTLNVTRPNSLIPFETTPFFLPLEARRWDTAGGPRRAAVSAFGMGGVNAHVIVEESAPHTSFSPTFDSRDHRLIRVSAASEDAVRVLAKVVASDLIERPSSADDVCATMTAGRPSHRFRAVVTGDLPAIVEGLERVAQHDEIVHRRPRPSQPSVFVYPGQGSQLPGMGLALMDQVPAFAETTLIVQEEATRLGIPIATELWALPADEIALTQNAQLAIVQFQVALTLLLQDWGIRPAATVGHSIGELTAIWAAGAMDLPTLLEIVARRAIAMGDITPRGAMAACWSSPAAVRALLPSFPGLEIAAINSPQVLTVSGPEETVERFGRESGLRTQLLKVSHAFHSAAMSQAGQALSSAIREHRDKGAFAAPRLDCAATCTLGWHTKESISSPELWGDSLTAPVLFAEAITLLGQRGYGTFVEISPRAVLSGPGRQTFPESLWLAPSRTGNDASLPNRGGVLSLVREISPFVEPNWEAICGGWHVRDAPLYPYQRTSFWIPEESND